LRGDDESVIRALFNNELLNYFESLQKISVKDGGGRDRASGSSEGRVCRKGPGHLDVIHLGLQSDYEKQS